MADAGADIVLNGRDPAKLAEAATQFSKPVQILNFDVTDHGAAREAIDHFEAENGAIDVLVNNAGMQHRGPLEDFPEDAFERLLKTNISSVFHVGQAVARHMIKRGRGKIINIASVQTALARPSIAPTPPQKVPWAILPRAWRPIGRNMVSSAMPLRPLFRHTAECSIGQ